MTQLSHGNHAMNGSRLAADLVRDQQRIYLAPVIIIQHDVIKVVKVSLIAFKVMELYSF